MLLPRLPVGPLCSLGKSFSHFAAQLPSKPNHSHTLVKGEPSEFRFSQAKSACFQLEAELDHSENLTKPLCGVEGPKPLKKPPVSFGVRVSTGAGG